MQLVEQGERPGAILRAESRGELIEMAAACETSRFAYTLHRDLL